MEFELKTKEQDRVSQKKIPFITFSTFIRDKLAHTFFPTSKNNFIITYFVYHVASFENEP